MRGLVGIDRRMFDQRMQTYGWFDAHIPSDREHGYFAIESRIDVACAGHLKACEPGQRRQRGNEFFRNPARGLLKSLRKFKRNGECELTHLRIGRLLNGNRRQLDLVRVTQDFDGPRAQKLLLF